MQTLWKDCLYAFRMLIKNPGFTAVAVVALALGIGANTAIFSVVNAVLLRPLPYPNADRLVTFRQGDGADGEPQMASMSYPDFVDYGRQAKSLEHVAAYTPASTKLTGRGGGNEPQPLTGSVASASLFPALGVGARLGRVFGAEEDKPGAAPVIVLSHDLWQRQFNADPRIVGAEITIADQATTVLGVMPAGFKFPVDAERVDYWMPLAANPGTAPMLTARGMSFVRVIAARAPQAMPARAAAEVDAVAATLAAQYPQTHTNRIVRLVPLHESLIGDLRPALLILLGAVGCVLLIACANVANLLVARAAARGKEIAIRTALGASRRRVVRQLLTESVLLSLLGGSMGLLLSLWGVDLLVAASPADVPRIADVSLDSHVLIFTVGVSLVTGIVFGLAPALQASQPDINETLKEGGRGATGSTNRRRFRSALIVSEVALALVLLIGAGLLLKSFWRLQGIDPGFDADNVLTMRVPLPATTYAEPAPRRAFYQRTLERITALPGVEAAGAASLAPLSQNNSSGTTTAENSAVGPNDLGVEADWRWVTPDYFRALDISLIKGRFFTAQDSEGAQPVAIVDESFARRFYPNEDAVGKRVKRGGFASQNPWMTIVGVVRYVRHRRLDADSHVQIYFPYYQDPAIPATMALVVRTNPAIAPMSLAAAVRAAVQDADKNQPVFNVKTMRQIIADSLAQQRMSMILLGTFAGVALILAAVGVYGLMNYTVASRTHEIGIRMALGAQERDVLRLIVRQGWGWRSPGWGRLLGAAAVTRVMASLLYGVSTSDAFIFASVPLLLTAVAFVACLVPARRAMRVEPVTALRYE